MQVYDKLIHLYRVLYFTYNYHIPVLYIETNNPTRQLSTVQLPKFVLYLEVYIVNLQSSICVHLQHVSTAPVPRSSLLAINQFYMSTRYKPRQANIGLTSGRYIVLIGAALPSSLMRLAYCRVPVPVSHH